MNKIASQKISGFLDDLSSGRPTPGGGAVASLTGALAASLCLMVARLTKNENFDKEIAKLEKMKERLSELADEDAAAFDTVLFAYKTKDKTKIRKALLYAIKVPLETASLATKVELLAKMLTKRGNKNAYSDAMGGVYLSQAARKLAQENVDINRKSL